MTDATFWKSRWDEGRIGFHEPETNPVLARHIDRLASGPTRVLVPLCGKSLDLAFLASRGHEVIGVELVERAAHDFFTERGATPRAGTHFGLPSLEAEGVTILVADIFALTAATAGTFAAIYDRAALIALPSEDRARYARAMTELAAPGARMLLVTVEYAQDAMAGPPFSVPFDEVEAHYAEHFAIEALDVSVETPAHLVARGLRELTERATLLERR